MGNACSCVSKNKELDKKEENNNKILPKEEVNEALEEANKASPEETKNEEAVPDSLYPDPPEDFKPDLVEPFGKEVIPLENEIPNEDEYNIPEKRLDELAITIGKHSFSSFIPLIYHLIYNRSDGIECNEYQKVCALFTWLTTKNLHELKFSNENHASDSPEAVLLGISTGKTAYAQVFQMLCRYTGLQCKLIRGYAKGVDYKPGMKLGGGKEAQHAWNAVKVDNVWYLFDCHWAARRLMGKTINSDRIKYDLDLFYFMTNPTQLRYTHFPSEEDWQLTKKKITLEEFEDLTLVKPTFFKYNLELYSHTQAVLEVQDKLVLMIKLPIELVEKICLTFTLTLEGLGEIYEGSNLTRYGIQETNKKTGICTLNFRFPKSGSYKLLLYAREYGDQIFGGICEYRVNAKLPEKEVEKNGEENTFNLESDSSTLSFGEKEENTSYFSGYIAFSRRWKSDNKHMEEEKLFPYPPTQQSSYGKTEMACQYNLNCSVENNSIRLTHGEFGISFFKENKENDNFPRLMGRLKSSFHDDSKLVSRLLQRNTYEKNTIDQFIILAFLPDAGEYALEIYANNPEKEGSSFFLIWQIFIQTEKGSDLPMGLPDINPGAAIGSQPQFQEFGLTVLSHPDPYITISNKVDSTDQEKHDLTVSIGLPLSNYIKILGQLVDVSSTEEETDYSDYLLQQNILSEKELTSVSFHVRIPKSGCFYKLHIYGAPATNETETLPMVFSYLINAPQRLSSSDVPYYGSGEGPYPYQLSQWKDKCRLYKPINRKIKINKDSETIIQFSLQIPDAYHVAAVVSGENWNQLSRENENSVIWAGDVKVDPSTPVDSKITVCACYNESITSYSTILEYYTC